MPISKIAVLGFFVFFVVDISPNLLLADETLPSDFHLYANDIYSNQIIDMPFDMAGYSDWWYWDNSERHNGSHEVLCGEWAGGVAYSISGHAKYEWLTDSFSFPTWPTGTSLQQVSHNEWDSSTNPVSGIDTARSVIHDPNIQITIDYKLVDLGASGYASLPFYQQGSSTAAYVTSERYFLTQTYNIKNLKSTDITGLKFYQLLVALPTQSLTRSSTYCNTEVPGLLASSYDPCTSSGSANKFKYAITQWTPGDPENPSDHVDWITFASTVPPNWIENGLYNWNTSGKPSAPGTHWNIEAGTLNGATSIYNDKAAGAMGWDLGTLTSGQTKSITIAVLFGYGSIQGLPRPVHNINQNTSYNTISSAVSYANDNDEIVCDPRTYNERVNIGSRKVTIRSTNPADRSVVANTIIQTKDTGGISLSGNGGSTINGFTIEDSAGTMAISMTNSTTNILNCIIHGTSSYGINISGGTTRITGCELKQDSSVAVYANAGDVNIVNCSFDGSSAASTGISTEGNNAVTLAVKICVIKNFVYNGIASSSATWAKTNNNLIYGCGLSGSFGFNGGIYFDNPYQASEAKDNVIYQGRTGVAVATGRTANITCQNNTLLDNMNGVLCWDSASTSRTIVKNCIIWGNTQNQIYAPGTPNVTYSCVQGTPIFSGTGNKNSDPCFVNAASHNYHIKAQSLCKDACGSFVPATGERDIDGDWRQYDGTAVDMGADEYTIEGFIALRYFFDAWLTAPGMTGWNPGYDFISDNIINFKDYAILANHWGAPTGWYSTPITGVGCSEFIAPPPQTPAQALYLAYDANTGPDPNGDVTVYVRTTVPIASMTMQATVAGDANVTSVMSTADCEQYGWYANYSSDSTVDSNGTVQITTATPLLIDANTTVGYFKVRPNSGQITVIPSTQSFAYDANWQPVTFSPTPVTINGSSQGGEPNEPNLPPPTPVLHLTCDNTTPDANSDVAVHIYSDVPLSCLSAGIQVSGDAIVFKAMDANDCSQYGWDSGWWTQSEIDPNGTWAYIGDIKGATAPSGDVGYFMLHYNSGEVSISVYDNSTADVNQQAVYFDTDPLVLGASGGQQNRMMMQSSYLDEQQATSTQQPEMNNAQIAVWLQHLWNTDAELRASCTEEQWQEFINSVRNGQ